MDFVHARFSGFSLPSFSASNEAATSTSSPTTAARSPRARSFQDAPHISPETKFLSPPASESSRNNERPPFKPTTSDHTSLSMVSHDRHVLNCRKRKMRTSIEGDKTQGQTVPPGPKSSRSVPDLKVMQWLETAPDLLAMKTLIIKGKDPIEEPSTTASNHGRDGLPRRPRRWTVPSKARATQSKSGMPTPKPRVPLMTKPAGTQTSALVSTYEVQGTQQISHPDFDASPRSYYSPDTPAMITLRRASRKYSIDIPESEGERRGSIIRRISSSGLTVFRTFSATNLQTHAEVEQEAPQSHRPSIYDESRIHVSVLENQAFPCCTAAACTASTEISVFPTNTTTGTTGSDAEPLRGTSIKITAGRSIHEVIWEDHCSSESPTSSAGRGTPRSRASIVAVKNETSRRHSVAVDRLQHQLRVSNQFRNRVKQAEEQKSQVHHAHVAPPSWRNLLTWEWRSQEKQRKSSLASDVPLLQGPDSDVHQIMVSRGQSLTSHADHVDFFPPICSQKNSEGDEESAKGHRSSLLCPISDANEPERSSSTPTQVSSAPVDSTSPLSRNESSKSLPESARHSKSRVGSSLGISSHVRRKSADHSRKVSLIRGASYNSARKAERKKSVPPQSSKGPPRRHSEYIWAERDPQPSTPRRSSVQEFIARFEAHNEAARKWSANSSRRPSAGELIRVSRVNTLGDVEEEKPKTYRSLSQSMLTAETGGAEAQGHRTESSQERDSVSVDWIG